VPKSGAEVSPNREGKSLLLIQRGENKLRRGKRRVGERASNDSGFLLIERPGKRGTMEEGTEAVQTGKEAVKRLRLKRGGPVAVSVFQESGGRDPLIRNICQRECSAQKTVYNI